MAAAALLLLFLLLMPLQAAAEGLDPPPGTRFEVPAQSLPQPPAGESVRNGARVVSRPRSWLPRAPEGFEVKLFAEGLADARWLAVAENGDVFLSEPDAGRVTLLRDGNGDGMAETRSTFLEGLSRPHGLAFRPGWLYVADVRAVWRVPYTPGDRQARAAPEQVTPEGALGDSAGHWTRNLVFAPDGSRFFVAIGSRSNLAVEPPPRASIKVFKSDGSGGRIFASGLRNPVGIVIRPGTEELWTVVNERDGMGDRLVPDYLTLVEEGAFYGWPYAYIGSNPQPGFAEKAAELVAKSRPPELLFRSHSAALGLVFYDGDGFPPAWRGDAFVALHGSWNAAVPQGYMVVRVPFEGGRPMGYYEAFLTGFRSGGPREGEAGRAEVYGRPVGLALAQDGSLLVADDAANVIWRVSYNER